MNSLETVLRESASRHKHLCPRQVLGARMALYAAELLDLDLPRGDKRLLITSETDGCFVDGLIAATGCHVGGRTLRILDFGKVAATLTDTYAERSVRIVPSAVSRSLAIECSPDSRSRWEAMLNSYQVLPADELFTVREVHLVTPLTEIISRPSAKAICECCGEEIINGREIVMDNSILCRACAGESYYRAAETTNFHNSHLARNADFSLRV
jgi:formylmethanofuran dehydrogenase subunit E